MSEDEARTMILTSVIEIANLLNLRSAIKLLYLVIAEVEKDQWK